MFVSGLFQEDLCAHILLYTVRFVPGMLQGAVGVCTHLAGLFQEARFVHTSRFQVCYLKQDVRTLYIHDHICSFLV